MANIIVCDDLRSDALAPYARLTEGQLRNQSGLFIAESGTVIGHALDAGVEPVSMLAERRHIEGKAAALIERLGDTPVYTAPDEVLETLTGYKLTRGVLCAMKRPAPADPASVLKHARRIAVLENIVDPTNIGTIFRNAAALGMDGILLSPACCDPLHRRAVRVSTGSVFQIPWARIDTSWPAKGIKMLHDAGFTTAALALDQNSISIEDPLLKQADKLALILGTEGTGLMAETIALSDHTTLIPMYNGVDSLNVAAAAVVAFWELRRR